MTRKRADEPYVQQKVNIPSTIAARFALLHMNPITGKVEYGAYSKIITALLTDYIAKTESERGLST